jgi:hypothetical protein
MTTSHRLLSALLFIAAPFLSTAIAQQAGYNKLQAGRPLGESTSVIRILANPDAFHGKRVRIEGFLHFEFEDSAIYLHQVDSDHMLSQNAIWINLPNDLSRELADKLNNHYVHCEGQFSAKDHGHMGAYGGELSDVHWIDISLSRAQLDKIVHGEK